jgi:hypothetical protein
LTPSVTHGIVAGAGDEWRLREGDDGRCGG